MGPRTSAEAGSYDRVHPVNDRPPGGAQTPLKGHPGSAGPFGCALRQRRSNRCGKGRSGCLAMGLTSRPGGSNRASGPGGYDRRTIARPPQPSHSGAYGSYRSANCRTPLSVLRCVRIGPGSPDAGDVFGCGRGGEYQRSGVSHEPGRRRYQHHVSGDLHRHRRCSADGPPGEDLHRRRNRTDDPASVAQLCDRRRLLVLHQHPCRRAAYGPVPLPGLSE